MARVSAFQAEGCGFETRLPLQIFRKIAMCSEMNLIEARGERYIINMPTDEATKRRVIWLHMGPCSSVVEHTLGKGEVVGSAPIMGSTKLV